MILYKIEYYIILLTLQHIKNEQTRVQYKQRYTRQ